MTIPMNNEYILKVHDVDHHFIGDRGEKIEVLRNVSFGVHEGEFFTILGPSGCGKSTLLRILGGLMKPLRGAIHYAHDDVQENLGIIFQSFAIFPWLTVYENVEFGLKMRGMARGEREKLVREHLKEIGLSRFERTYPKDLSGGMKQRVGIARALALEPRLLLMDEPFSSLDAFTAEKLREETLTLWLKDKITIIMVTHLTEEAVEMSDRVLVMTPRPGRVEAVLEINLPRPRNKRSDPFFKLVDKINEIVKV